MLKPKHLPILFVLTAMAATSAAGAECPSIEGIWPVGQPELVVTSGNYAYIYGNKALWIADLSAPSEPVIVGSLFVEGGAGGIEIFGNHVILARTFGFVVVDVEDPYTPFEVGRFDITGGEEEIQCFALCGSLLAFGRDESFGDELLLVDVSDPTSPFLTGGIELPYSPGTHADRIACDDSYAYLLESVHSTSGQLHAVDISWPAYPVYIDFVETQVNYVDEISVTAGFAYLSARSFGLRIYDVRSPIAMEHAGTFHDYTNAAEVNGTFAYVAGGSAVHALGVWHPSEPVYLASVELGMPLNDIAMTGSAVCAVGVDGGATIDVSDPFNPAFLTSFGPAQFGTAYAAAGGFAYVIDDIRDNLFIVDFNRPGWPIQVASFAVSTPARTLAHADGLLYLVSDILRVFDVGDPQAPAEITSLELPALGFEHAALNDDLLFLGKYSQGSSLLVVDVANPQNPQLVGESEGLWVQALASFGDHVFVAGSTSVLFVVDVSDPTAPQIVSETYAATGLCDIFALDGLVFVAGLYSFVVFDVSDPTSPVEISRIEGLPNSPHFAYSQGMVFLTGSSTLMVVDVKDPHQPTVLFEVENPLEYSNRLVIDGSRLIASTRSKAVAAYDISCVIPIFADGFESGDSSAWTLAVP